MPLHQISTPRKWYKSMNGDLGRAIFTFKDFSYHSFQPGQVLAAIMCFALSGPGAVVFGEPAWVFAYVMCYFLCSYSVTLINCR